MSRRSALLCALVLSSLIVSLSREARAQAEPMTATILRRTAVRIAPEAGASTIAFVNPGTFEVTEARLQSGFVRLLLSQIDPRRPAGGFGFIAAADIAIDSAMTKPVAASMPTPAAVTAAAAPPARSEPAVVTRPPAVSPAPPAAVTAPRKDTATITRAVATRDSVPPLARFLVGVWSCQGGTPAGRTLTSEVRFVAQLGDRWLQSAHVDVPPGRYSSLALWPLAPADSEPLTTVVYDNSGGARRFLLDGWTPDSVVLVRDRTERGARVEQFTYRRVSPDSYWYAWHVRRGTSGPTVLGDSATCTRRPPTSR
jgi:hypothetical protein